MMSKNRLPGRVLCLALLLCCSAACGKKQPPELPAVNRLESYRFDPASPLESRIKVTPPLVLEFLRAFDNRQDYSLYAPAAADRRLIMKYLRLLPPVYEKTFRERCVGIYFVPGLVGNGLTDWVAGPEGKIYFQMTLNPDSLKKTISETLSGREASCFIPGEGWTVRVDAGSEYRGLLYALLHEGAHGLDYALGISPYADNSMPARYRPGKTGLGGFFMESWSDYSKPLEGANFPGRDKVAFYGLNGGPKLRAGEAAALYRGLLKSGFVSLYGSQSWGEDLAELATFSVLAKKLGQPVAIILRTPERSYRLEPLSGPAGARAGAVLKYLEGLK